MIWRALSLIAAVAALPVVAAAQTVRVVAGEHADFTRIVLRVPTGVDWSIDGAGPERVFATDREVTFDVTTLFDRIPRTRLASARTDAEGLKLVLACDCPVRAWQDRPGLVVIDISNPGSPAEIGPQTTAQTPAPRPVPEIDTTRAARAAGERLARERVERSPGLDAVPQPSDEDSLAGLAEDLGRQFAQALGQGLLEAPITAASNTAVLRPQADAPDLPDNMRIVDVTTRSDVESAPALIPDPACRGAEALDFLLDHEGPAFAQGLSQYGQALFGEFDQASDEGYLNLVRHYLSAGFGAEARALITNLRDPLIGRDILLGFSDVLEGRMSNSRMRLAEALECGGAAAVGAVLAHPENRTLGEIAAPIALAFDRFPPALRAALGTGLVRALVTADAIDEARIVADSMRQSLWAATDDVVLVEALLDGGRGDTDRAAERLDSIAMRNTDGTIAWLDLAIREGTPVAPSALDDAEAIASENRDIADGVTIMAAAIRLRARSDQPDGALVSLDRLETWADGQSETLALVETLRDEVWLTLAETADDHALIALTLARSDWLDPALSLGTRQALATRLVDLGFARAADRLLAPETDSQSLRLRALAALQQDDPAAAIPLIEQDPSVEALEIRAAAASQTGQYAQAAALLDSAGIVDAAARAAILDGDWRRLDDLRRRGAEPGALAEDANAFLGLEPGIAEITLSRAVTEDAAPMPIESPEVPLAESPDASAPAQVTDTAPLSAEATFNPAEVLDRMGMVSRAGVLLAESERLRSAIDQTLQSPTTP